MARVGDTIAGKYLLTRELGQGGMGVVFEATNNVTEAKVALKMLGAEAAKNEFVTGRFMREAKAAARLRSRYVARVFDADRTATGEPFIVMELLHGHDLAEELERGPMSVQRACTLIMFACAGMHEAHLAGIVHRDLKPANLFLAMEGTEIVKVLDFGVSKLPFASDGDPTGSMAILGTLRYMSPEHFSDARSVDARADIWALGVILFTCLEGRNPFPGDGPPMIGAVLSPQPTPRITRPDVPAALVDLVARCLEKDVRRRLANVAELAEGLAAFASPVSAADPLSEMRARSSSRQVAGIDAFGATIASGEHPAMSGASRTVTSTNEVTAPPTSRTDALGPKPIPAPPPARGNLTTILLALATVGFLALVAVKILRKPPAVAEPAPPAPPPPTVIVSAAPPPPPAVTVVVTASASAPSVVEKPGPKPKAPPTPKAHDAGAAAIPTLL